MITSPTLLILGAGASIPYGFPSGPGLRTRLVQAPKIGARNIFSQCGFSDDKIGQFRKEFLWSQQSSIDRFLFQRPEFSEIGKVAIAITLIADEDPNALLETRHTVEAGETPPKHWYRYLWNQISESWENFEANQLRIVTFNYDRSLEEFLSISMQKSFGKPREIVEPRIAHLRIKHVYGQLGLLGQLLDATAGTRPFSPELSAAAVQVAAAGIRTIHERDQNTECFESIAEDISWAKTVCFLGFSYDTINLDRLGAQLLRTRTSTPDPTAVFGTALGLEHGECRAACRMIGAHPDNVRALDSEVLLRHFLILR